MQLSQPTPSQTKKQKLNKASMELLENTRSMSLLLFFYCLNHKERWSLLGGILGYKTKVRNELNNFLKYRAIVNQQQNTGVKVLKGKKPPASSNNTALHEDSVSLGLLRRTKYNLLQMLPVPLTGTHHSASAVNEHHKKSQQMLEKLQETK